MPGRNFITFELKVHSREARPLQSHSLAATKKQPLPVLSALQAKRAIQKGIEQPYLVVVRDTQLGLDPEGGIDPLDSLNNVSEAERHIGDGPCDRDKLRALLAKYACISPDELPGFPPERGRGHSMS